MKAISLISGGLDSILATKLIQGLNIELIALNTVSPFCLCNHRSPSGCFYGARQVAKDLGLKLISIDVSSEILEIVKKPRYGYGSNMNPCIDCRILLFKKARELMQREGAGFIITGEVLGQRPMSQRLNIMRLIEKQAGLEGMVLRPLSARVLEATVPEKEGWVSRDKLLAISGRGRRQQMDLAREFGINDYPCPSGGCLLTDPEFSRRLKDLMKNEGLNLNNIELIKIGRHFRLDNSIRLVVGRNEKENARLLDLANENDYLFIPYKIAGPAALGRGNFNPELIRLSCAIMSRYCDRNGAIEVEIIYKQFPKQEEKFSRVQPLEEAELLRLRV